MIRMTGGAFLLLGCLAAGACGPDSETPTASLLRRSAALTLPELERQIQSGTPELRRIAVWTLKDRGAAARDAVPFLVESLQDEDPSVVDAVFSALEAIGPAPLSSLPRLRCALKEHVPAVRQGAAEAIGGVGPGALEAAEDLIEALGDRDCSVRVSAMHALVAIGERAVPALLEALADHSPGLGRLIMTTLNQIVPEGRAALASLGDPVLEEILALDR
jgi:HEAT repeat protein